MTILEKAKELGRELRNTEEYQKLEEVNRRLNEDTGAQQLIKSFQEAQRSLQFAQQSGVKPTEEQIADYQQKQKNLETNLNIIAYMKASNDFYAVMQQVNEAISAGLGGDKTE